MYIPTCIEICAGGGGQALGLERAGFGAECLVEIDAASCSSLRANRPQWNVSEGDVRQFDASAYRGIDLLAGGVPCPPFSVAGKQLGSEDERDLFPEALRIVEQTRPKAVMLENVRGFLGSCFDAYREQLKARFEALGYRVGWHLLHASDFGVSQLRPRVAIVALRKSISDSFHWPMGSGHSAPSVGALLVDLMAENGWEGAESWALGANDIAPTLVGGSKKHGGADLGPSRARQAWEKLGVNAKSLADQSPERGFVGLPRLTTRMTARLQGFPDTWRFEGRKTAAYRQIGNAFPPPVANAVAAEILRATSSKRSAVAFAS